MPHHGVQKVPLGRGEIVEKADDRQKERDDSNLGLNDALLRI